MLDYSLVFAPEVNYIWKSQNYHALLPVFLRKDLLEEYDREPLADAKYGLPNGLAITDEMWEQYESGVPMSEVIKPYWDAMFGEAG
jgi:hypothetical protein